MTQALTFEGLNGVVALAVDGYFFSNFDGWRLSFRALDGWRLFSENLVQE